MQENQREKKKSEKKIHIRPDVHRSVQQRSDIQLSESRASLRNHAAPPFSETPRTFTALS